MKTKDERRFDPRKMPVQARATVTVAAISEATIQVLLSHGAERLTTTRVAERAGVSVGTLYQYYPNKQSLLFAILEQELDRVTCALERACEQSRDKLLADMLRDVIAQFLDAKMQSTEISTALYRISAETGGPELLTRMRARSLKALAAVLKTASDVAAEPDSFSVDLMYSAMAGATRTVLEAGAPADMVQKLRAHLPVLCRSYMRAVCNGEG